MDVKTAFLNNELDVEIYMEPGGVYSKRPRAPRMQVEEIAIPFEEIQTSVVRCIHISIVHKDFTRHHGDHSYWEIKKKKQRDQRRKVEHNTQGLHTMERVISSSPYAFIYMCRLGPALTTHMGQYHYCNLTLPSNTPTLRCDIVLQYHYFT